MTKVNPVAVFIGNFIGNKRIFYGVWWFFANDNVEISYGSSFIGQIMPFVEK